MLGGGPQTYRELSPIFDKEFHKVPHEIMPEMRDLLEENFLKDDASGQWRIPDPGRDGDLRALRERALLREFAGYLKGKGHFKTFRAEAVRAGFSRAWKDRDYNVILQVADRLPERVFLSSEKGND